MSKECKSTKGEFGGICYRTSCQKPGATWFNHSTVKFYCDECAAMINDANRAEAYRIFGHELCCKHEPEERVMSKSLYDDIHSNRSTVVLDDFIEYIECTHGDVRGKIRISIDDPGGNISHKHIVIPFSSYQEQNILSEADAIRYLKYLTARTILESITDESITITNFQIMDA